MEWSANNATSPFLLSSDRDTSRNQVNVSACDDNRLNTEHEHLHRTAPHDRTGAHGVELLITPADAGAGRGGDHKRRGGHSNSNTHEARVVRTPTTRSTRRG